MRQLSSTAASTAASFRFDSSSPLFEGHFEGTPILPGVAHIAIVLAVCDAQRLELGRLCGLRNIRFSYPIRPEDDICVKLEKDQDSMTLRFEIRNGDRTASTGLLLFGVGR